MSMAEKQNDREYKTRLSERDLIILMEIYQLQAIRARDLAKVHYKSERHGLQRLQDLCWRGYIERTFTVKGTGQRNQSVYNISDKGIEELYKLGRINQERRARDLKLPTMEMLTRIEVSKIAISLEKAGWQVLGSRDGKIHLGLNPKSTMQLALTTPEGKTYQAYVLNKSILDQTLSNLIGELNENKYGSIVLYKADTFREITLAYQNLVKEITEEQVTSLELCLIPMFEWNGEGGTKRNFALETLLYGDKIEPYLRKHYDRVKYGDNRYHFGNLIVEQGESEFMVCNYLCRDQSAIRTLARNYTITEYKNIRKGVIVLTWNGLVEEARQIIDSYQIRDFIQIQGITVQDISDSHEATQ